MMDQPRSMGNEANQKCTVNRDKVLNEVLKELAYLRNRTLSPMSTNSSLSLATPCLSVTSIPVSKNDSGIESTDKEMIDNPKLDDLLTVTGTDECFRTDTRKVIPKDRQSTENGEYSRTGYERDDHREHHSYDNRNHSERAYTPSRPYRENCQNHERGKVNRGRKSYSGWPRFRYNTQYSQPERRACNYRNETQQYHSQPWTNLSQRRWEHSEQPSVSSDRYAGNRREQTTRRSDDLRRSDMLDMSTLNPELLDKIQELIRSQR